VDADFTAVPSLAPAVAAPPGPVPTAPLAAGLDPAPVGAGVGGDAAVGDGEAGEDQQRRQTSL
jgi:hypothetical protein